MGKLGYCYHRTENGWGIQLFQNLTEEVQLSHFDLTFLVEDLYEGIEV